MYLISIFDQQYTLIKDSQTNTPGIFLKQALSLRKVITVMPLKGHSNFHGWYNYIKKNIPFSLLLHCGTTRIAKYKLA